MVSAIRLPYINDKLYRSGLVLPVAFSCYFCRLLFAVAFDGRFYQLGLFGLWMDQKICSISFGYSCRVFVNLPLGPLKVYAHEQICTCARMLLSVGSNTFVRKHGQKTGLAGIGREGGSGLVLALNSFLCILAI